MDSFMYKLIVLLLILFIDTRRNYLTKRCATWASNLLENRESLLEGIQYPLQTLRMSEYADDADKADGVSSETRCSPALPWELALKGDIDRCCCCCCC